MLMRVFVTFVLAGFTCARRLQEVLEQGELSLLQPVALTRPSSMPVLLTCVFFCREFVFGNYTDLKKANPLLPILVRECEGISAKIWARYGV